MMMERSLGIIEVRRYISTVSVPLLAALMLLDPVVCFAAYQFSRYIKKRSLREQSLFRLLFARREQEQETASSLEGSV